MTIDTMIQLLTRFGIRSDLIDGEEQDFYIHYLNLAHLELYRTVAPYIPSLVIQEEGRTVEGKLELSQNPFLILGVQNTVLRTELAKTRPESWVSQNINPDDEGTADSYWSNGRIVQVVPREDTFLRIYFVPFSTDLTLDTVEDEIPYPREFHPLLIDGALKYLQQDVDTSSIKDSTRIQRAAAEWEKGKGELRTFIINQGGPLRVQAEYF